jgi:alkylation response protein AidB-like acyl-CoA dehydrogenase
VSETIPELPEEYRELSATVRDFAEQVVAPFPPSTTASTASPYEVVAGMAELGLFGLPFPEEYGGMGGDYFALPGARGAREGRSERRHHARGRRLARRHADLPVRHRGAEAALAAFARGGTALGAFGLTEAGRQRCRPHPTTARLDGASG